MKQLPSQSPADEAYQVFQDLVRQSLIFSRVSPDLTESDTRAKLIDPVFKQVLGWQEQDIRREKPVADGFVDYLIGAEFPYFHIEAKRLLPRFQIQSPSRARVLSLSGPHLLANKSLRDFLEQTARYAFELGTDFTMLTNGDQFILFKTHLEGKPWRDGHAYVWHDAQDILENFAEFYHARSAEDVRSGSLVELFSNIKGFIRTYSIPRQFIFNPDQEFVRNHFWNKISAVFGPFLSDQPQDEDIQLEIIQNCYVRTPLSDHTDKQIDALLSDNLPPFLDETGVSDVGLHQAQPFHQEMEKDIKSLHFATYIITGGVGCGKTTFLKRYAKVFQPGMIKAYCIWLHIDYLPLAGC